MSDKLQAAIKYFTEYLELEELLYGLNRIC